MVAQKRGIQSGQLLIALGFDTGDGLINLLGIQIHIDSDLLQLGQIGIEHAGGQNGLDAVQAEKSDFLRRHFNGHLHGEGGSVKLLADGLGSAHLAEHLLADGGEMFLQTGQGGGIRLNGGSAEGGRVDLQNVAREEITQDAHGGIIGQQGKAEHRMILQADGDFPVHSVGNGLNRQGIEQVHDRGSGLISSGQGGNGFGVQGELHIRRGAFSRRFGHCAEGQGQHQHQGCQYGQDFFHDTKTSFFPLA